MRTEKKGIHSDKLAIFALGTERVYITRVLGNLKTLIFLLFTQWCVRSMLLTTLEEPGRDATPTFRCGDCFKKIENRRE